MMFKYNKENLLNVGGNVFKAGIADYPKITPQIFQTLVKDYPKLKFLLDNGDLETQSGSDSSDEGSGLASSSADPSLALEGLREKDAISIVRQATDENLLQSWLSQKQPGSVEKAIREQLKAIEKAKG